MKTLMIFHHFQEHPVTTASIELGHLIVNTRTRLDLSPGEEANVVVALPRLGSVFQIDARLWRIDGTPVWNNHDYMYRFAFQLDPLRYSKIVPFSRVVVNGKLLR